MVLQEEWENVRMIMATALSTLCQTEVSFQQQLTVKADITLGVDQQEPVTLLIEQLLEVCNEQPNDDLLDNNIVFEGEATVETPEERPKEPSAEGTAAAETDDAEEPCAENHLNVTVEKTDKDHAVDMMITIKKEMEQENKKACEVDKVSPPTRKRGRPPGRKSAKSKFSKKKVNLSKVKVEEKHAASENSENDQQKEPDCSSEPRPKRRRTKQDEPIPTATAENGENDPQKESGCSDEPKPKRRRTKQDEPIDPKDVKKEKLELKCDQCDFTTKSKGVLQRHTLIHSRPDQLTCKYCDETFPDRYSRKRHCKEYHDGEKVPCDICNKKFSTFGSLKLHQKNLHPDQFDSSATGQYRCEGCGQFFMTVGTLERHLRLAKHCDICDTEMKCKQDLKTHMLEVHPDVPKILQCEFCEKVLSSKTGMYAHKLLFHGEEMSPVKKNVFTCHVCGKGFPIYDYLKRHIRSHDASYMPYECPKCKKRFKYHRNCKTHKEGCMNEAGYQCHKCGKRLKNEYCLRIHVRNAHPEERKKNFPCSKCGTTFTNTVLRSKHEVICMDYNVQANSTTEDNSEQLPKLEKTKADINPPEITHQIIEEPPESQTEEETLEQFIGNGTFTTTDGTIIQLVREANPQVITDSSQLPVHQYVEVYDEQSVQVLQTLSTESDNQVIAVDLPLMCT